MTLREKTRILAYFVCLVVVSGSAFCGEEPVQNPAPASPANQTTAAVRFRSAALPYALEDVTFSLAADTYGNALGVDVADIDAALRAQLGTADGIGVVVTKVNKESEAAKAGLEQYDLILKADEQEIGGPKQFHDLVARQKGKSVTFHILRKGKPATATLTVPDTPVYTLHRRGFPVAVTSDNVALGAWLTAVPAAQVLALNAVGADDQYYRVGVTLSEADDTLRSQLRLAAGEGLVVTEVVDDMPAAKSGIQKNDVLIKLDGKRLTTVEAINTQIQETKDRKVTVALFRGGSEITLEFAPRLVKEPSYQQLVVSHLGELVRMHDADLAHRIALNALVEARIEPAPQPTAAEQLATLKKQLAELQKSVAALEAALQAAPAAKQATPEEKKTEEKK